MDISDAQLEEQGEFSAIEESNVSHERPERIAAQNARAIVRILTGDD